jgi:hypothetical protein
MSVKGSWTRVTDRDRYERNKERIYMNTDALLKSLISRCLKGMTGGSTTIRTTRIWIYQQAMSLKDDVRSVDKLPGDEAKALRRLIMDLHKQLDEVNDGKP